MTSQLSAHVWTLKLRPALRELLLALLDHAHDDGSGSRPGVPLLAWKLDISERQVQRLLREAEEKGLIEITDRPARRPFEYRVDLSRAESKAPFQGRQNVTVHASKDDNMSPSKSDNMSPKTPFYGDNLSPTNTRSGDKTSPLNDDKLSPSEREIAAMGDRGTRKTASSTFSLSKESNTGDPSDESEERERAGARESTHVPYHVANGLGRKAPADKSPLIRAIEERPVYQAFVRGWDGITPVIADNAADRTWKAVQELESDVKAKQITLKDIEELTRWKVNNAKAQGDYRIGFIRADFPAFLARRRAQQRNGQGESVASKYADFFER